MRVFAGPNGSGKSTIIKAVREYRIKEMPVDFGTYVNADDIAITLRNKNLNFSNYKITTNEDDFISVVLNSGLINSDFNEKAFRSCIRIENNKAVLLKESFNDRIAQIIADFLRKKLLQSKKKFSFETVFSHPSKLDIMREAQTAGYKVYLYFISTESPEVNKYRVQLRKEKGGHDVPLDRIQSCYYRSLELMFNAAQLCYQAFFFDNSGRQPELFAHFKLDRESNKKWDKINRKKVPEWFKQYYSNKVKDQND